MYIIGASGHAKAIIDLFEDKNAIKSIFDDDIQIKKLLDFEVVSPVPVLLPDDAPYIIAIGNNKIRKNLAETILSKSDFLNVVHSSAILSKNLNLGYGNVVMELAIIKVGSTIGNHVILNTRTSVDHDCIIEDFVHLAPGVSLCGGVSVGEGTLVGAGSVVLPNIKIGKWCTIGAGSVVHQSISNGQTWIGDSLKIHKI